MGSQPATFITMATVHTVPHRTSGLSLSRLLAGALAATLIALALVVSVPRAIAAPPAPTSTGGPASSAARTAAPNVPTPPKARAVLLSGLDLHDGTVVKSGNLYYLYGTRYGCGFTWGVVRTPFCGFGVSASRSLTGPWSKPRLLFSPAALDTWGPDRGKRWNYVCGNSGSGCFNPRMVKRPDGQWMLWFNAPSDHTNYGANAYYVMGCKGPFGPCGQQAGPRHGFTAKPSLRTCITNGDFSILTAGSHAAIVCSQNGIYVEGLDSSWINGTGRFAGIPARVSAAELGSRSPFFVGVGEGVGAAPMPDGSWMMTFSSPGCGYCTGPPLNRSAGGHTGVKTGFAIAPTIFGPWRVRGNLSARWCTGQPRTAFTVDGQPYQWVDRWLGTRNETGAGVLLKPLPAAPGSWSCS